MAGTTPERGEPARTKGEDPLGAAGRDEAEPAFKEEEDAPVFEDMIDGWEYRVTKAIAKGLGWKEQLASEAHAFGFYPVF